MIIFVVVVVVVVEGLILKQQSVDDIHFNRNKTCSPCIVSSIDVITVDMKIKRTLKNVKTWNK